MNSRWSLYDAFTPPEDWAGVAALMCALSADGLILEGILRAFTGISERARATRGSATALLLIDRKSERNALRTLPGLHVADPVLSSWSGNSMLHAKVALLGFARDHAADIELIRLVVSTGNWTKASLSRDIDMVWAIDLDLLAPEQEQIRSDIRAAARMYDRLLNPGSEGQAYFQQRPSSPRWDELLIRAAAYDGRKRPRFIHSIDRPLLKQIAERFEPSAQAWNWLHIGSGFYEQPAEGAPQVLPKIVAALGRSLTSTSTKSVTLNPDRAGAFAAGIPNGWRACRPRAVDNRTWMHAKFIAAGVRRLDRYNDLTVYLGSGNLSKSGMLTAFTAGGANTRIEAGVVFKAGAHAEGALRRLLPDWEDLHGDEIEELVAGDTEDDRQNVPPPPVLFARVVAGAKGKAAHLQLYKSDPEAPAEVQVGETVELVPIGMNELPATDFQEPYLSIRVTGAVDWIAVPVLGLDGGFARVAPTPGSINDVLEALMAFPGISDPEEGVDDGEVANSKSGTGQTVSRGSISGYPARDAMRLVEELSAVTTRASKSDRHIDALILEARRMLLEGLREQDRTRLVELGINFLEPLKTMPAMPTSPAWRDFVEEIAIRWGLSGLPSLATMNKQELGVA